MNANYSHIPSPNNIYADGMAIGRPDPRTQNERVFDPSPNGTSLPLTYAPRACKIAQFSESGFDNKSRDADPTSPITGLVDPGAANYHNLPNSTPPQGWQTSYDSALHRPRLTANSRTMVDPHQGRVQPTSSVAELIAPGEHFSGPPARNGLKDSVSIQDWQSNLDSRLCARRQYRGQGI